MGPWCYVDLTTCHNQPFVDSSGGSYDACAATNDTTTYDTGAACACWVACLSRHAGRSCTFLKHLQHAF